MKIIELCTEKQGSDIVLIENNSYSNQSVNLPTPSEVVEFFNKEYRLQYKTEEHVYICALTTKNKILNVFKISQGTVNASLVSAREVFINLLLVGAVNYIMIHNHPSGDPTFSESDINVQKIMRQAGEIMGVNLIDFIVVGDNCFLNSKSLQD